MDIGATAFSIYGQIMPLIASAGAGLATFALLSGTAKIKREKPSALPSDPEAAQTKYALALEQLIRRHADPASARAETQSAIYLAAAAFEKYQTPRKAKQ
jgi:hypothetical protein